MKNEPTLRECLSVPYLVEAETIEVEQGSWLRRAVYPELPECTAEAEEIEDTLERLERRRVERILEILRSGAVPPLPRPALPDCDPEGVLRQLGFGAEIVALLDRSASEMSGRDPVTETQ